MKKRIEDQATSVEPREDRAFRYRSKRSQDSAESGTGTQLLHLVRRKKKEIRTLHRPRYHPMDIGSLNPELCHKKGRPRDNRHGKAEQQVKHHIAHNLR